MTTIHPEIINNECVQYAHHYPESLRAGIEVLDKVRKKVNTILAQSYGRQEVSTT